jgi:hypothetical protein
LGDAPPIRRDHGLELFQGDAPVGIRVGGAVRIEAQLGGLGVQAIAKQHPAVDPDLDGLRLVAAQRERCTARRLRLPELLSA